MSVSKATRGGDSSPQVPPNEAEKVPGYVRRLIRERKKSKKQPEVARARVKGRGLLTGRARKLFDLLKDDDLEAAVRVWREGLQATKRFWNPAAKQWIEEPDWRTRHDMSMAIAAYMEGKPVERQMVVAGSFDDFEKLVDRLKLSALAREELAGLPGVERVLSEGERGENGAQL
jgi:hypothetical protein